MYVRKQVKLLEERLKSPRKWIQILAGPRQVGKTTLAQQTLDSLKYPGFYASADSASGDSGTWIEQQWERARIGYGNLDNHDKTAKGLLLVLDEVQKAADWSRKVKALWDEDTRENRNIKAVLLGSSPLLMQKGLTESLAGRFEIIRMTHWSYREMKEAFNLTLDEYIYFGGYPGTVSIRGDETRWKQHVRDSLIETTVSKDILMMTRIDKPALLKNLFETGCHYSGQILSFNKLLGQLQDAGNTVTLSHYLELLSNAGLLTGIHKYTGKSIQGKSSSPKFQVFNNGLASALSGASFSETRNAPEEWGRRVESAVGSHLINTALTGNFEVFYWRDRNREVDFVLKKGNRLIAIEVKTGKKKDALPGLNEFCKKFKNVKPLLIGQDGIPLEEFFLSDLDGWFGE